MQNVEIEVLAEALSCHPRTLSRLITGTSNPYSKPKAQVSLGLFAQHLKTAQAALSRVLSGEDEAVDLEMAAMVLDLSERQVRRLVTNGDILPIARFGHTLRFSLNDLKKFDASRSR